MKNLYRYMMAFSIALLLIACKKEIDRGFKTSCEYTPAFVSGQWNITGFVKDGVYKTNKFSDYPIRFSKEYEISIEHNEKSYSGEWSVTGIDETADALPVDLNFIINIKSPVFSDINGSWVINERTMNELSLSRANAIGKNDTLIISKR